MRSNSRLLTAFGALAVGAILISALAHTVAQGNGYPQPGQIVSFRTVMKFKSIPDRDQTLLLLKEAPGPNGFVLTELYFSEDRGQIANGVPHAPRINRGFDIFENEVVKWTDPSLGGGVVDVDHPPKWFPGLRFAAGSKVQLNGQVFSAISSNARDFMVVTLVGYTF